MSFVVITLSKKEVNMKKKLSFSIDSYYLESEQIIVRINGPKYVGEGLDPASFNRLERMRGGKALNYLKQYVSLEPY